MKNKKVIIFDVDGTLLDMKNLILQSYTHTFTVYGLGNITWRNLTPLMGFPLKECYEILTKKTEVNSFCKTHVDFQKKNLFMAQPFLNTLQTLKILKEKKIKLVAFTSRSKETSIKTLKMTNIFQYFNVIISREDVLLPKPDPEGLLKVLNKYKISKDYAYMVGDTSTDIQTGKNARVKTIGASYGFIGNNIIKCNPDYVINDISETINIVTI